MASARTPILVYENGLISLTSRRSRASVRLRPHLLSTVSFLGPDIENVIVLVLSRIVRIYRLHESARSLVQLIL